MFFDCVLVPSFMHLKGTNVDETVGKQNKAHSIVSGLRVVSEGNLVFQLKSKSRLNFKLC